MNILQRLKKLPTVKKNCDDAVNNGFENTKSFKLGL